MREERKARDLEKMAALLNMNNPKRLGVRWPWAVGRLQSGVRRLTPTQPSTDPAPRDSLPCPVQEADLARCRSGTGRSRGG